VEGARAGDAVDEGAWAAPKHTKAPAGAAAEAEEYEDEPAPARPRPRTGPAPSKGAEAFESVKNGARYTLRGLRLWQDAARWGTLGEFFALVAALLLVVLLALPFAGVIAPVGMGTAGMFLGVATLAFWLWALFQFVRGARWAHRGRDELGYLQRREVDAALAGVLRGAVLLAIVGSVAVFLGLQAETFARAGRIPDAAAYALVVGVVAAALGVLPFSRGLAGMLRNLTPVSGRRGRRRFVTLMLLWVVPSVAVYLVGAPLAYLDFDVACQELGECRAAELMPLLSPPYGAPGSMLGEPPAALYLEVPLAGALVLLVARLAGYRALRILRGQLEEADLFLVHHVASRAAAAAPSGLAA